MKSNFVHLHVHSEFSVLDGACKIKSLLDRCEQFGMEACALTDHGNLFGAVEFYKEAKARGIKPILGSELYIAPGSRTDTHARFCGEVNNHFLLLCADTEGYHNLCKLSTAGYLEGFYYKPRIDDELLRKYHKGLIATSSCLAGRIPTAILKDQLELARSEFEKYMDIFGKENFLVELMDHGLEEQRKVNRILIEMARYYGLTVIATNDCHYVDREDAEAHDALLCIQTNTTIDAEDRFRFSGDKFYFRPPQEMAALFAECPEAVANTVKVAERCNAEIPLGQSLIPKFEVPEGYTAESYLERLVEEGLKERYRPLPPEYRERARYELSVIERMKFVDYFLVVWDLIRHAREQGIPVGPGRGSGAGSIVAYALKITNIDPMRYQLLFERFLNPDRVSMPDFDIDFCYNRRDEMIRYAYDKYGRENVSQIITFGRMLAKNVVRGVGRVMGMSYGDVDRIAKLIPEDPKITLKVALEKEPQLRKLIAEDSQIAKLWQLATRLEGTVGNCGTHAAGVVICDHPLTEHVALYKAANSDTIATQAEMKCVEEIGLLKMDFLGLRTLTVVHDAVRLIRQNKGIEIDIDNIEPDDPKAYALLRSGQTNGVFQLESAGMRDLARRIGLESLEEMSALVALYRPGPMDFIDTYIQNKFHPEKIVYDHPILESILRETYGIAVYQEQVMQMVQQCAGFSLGQADIVRRAMGKKKKDLLDKQMADFIDGCAKNGIEEKLARSIWEKIETFAGYGFNKSHSVAYAYVAYQTAFLKANYPVEFMCALLTSESGNLDKAALYVDECRRMGIEVLPPDINRSFTNFAVEGNAIRFGLSAIKNVGVGPTENIVAEREARGPFHDIFDLCARLDSRVINRRVLESLNKAGALISTGWSRRQVEAVLDEALSMGQSAQKDRAAGQSSLFELEELQEDASARREPPALADFPEQELLQMEKEMLGLYISSHPLLRHADVLRWLSTANAATLRQCREGEEVNLGGLVAQVKTHITSKGAKMAFLTIETLEGPCEATAFSDIFAASAGLLVPDAVVMLQGRVNYRNNEPGLIVDMVLPVEEAAERLARAVHVRLPAEELDQELAERVARVIDAHGGTGDVYLHFPLPDGSDAIIHATDACRVRPSRAVCKALEAILGAGSAWLGAGGGLPSHQPRVPRQAEQPRWKARGKVERD